jgi:F-type H+-transporting ATPase subunit delta
MKSILTISSNEELSTFIQNPTTELKLRKAPVEIFASINGVTKGLFHLLFENVLKFRCIATEYVNYLMNEWC